MANDIAHGSSYAALSHCWGSASFLTLCQSNVQQFQSRIPPEALSRTIRDAIETARELGFPYIWIDTLCIVQDDASDWTREATSMAAVYGNAGVTIAASGASDGNGGLNLQRLPHQKCRVDLSRGHESQSYVFVPLSFQTSCLSCMPLMKRGWAFQERSLSARTLHFTTTEVFWECNQTSASETFPEGLPAEIVSVRNFLTKQPLTRSSWRQVVKSYSECQLTYAEDKLIAISGVARKIQQQTGDQYIAGMWRDGLEAQLGWCTTEPKPRRETTNYIAPSWSWTSLDTAVRPFNAFSSDQGDFPKYIEILDVEVKLAGSDLLGALLYARLTISCHTLLRVLLGTHPFMGYRYMELDGKEVHGGMFPDVTSPETEDEPREAIALPIVQLESNGWIICLLLERVDLKKGFYRRVGLFNAPFNEQGKWFSEIVDGKQIYAVDSDDYYEVRLNDAGSPRYVIDLI
jgi:hypothetical protein